MPAMTNVQPHQRPTIQWRQAILLGVVLIVGSTLTLLAGRNLQQYEALRLKEKQTAATQAIVSAFDLELTRTTEAIRNAGLMIESNPNLTRDQFNRYMQKLVTSQLSVSLVELQPIVPAGALAQFEAAARKEGSSNYRVEQPDASGKGWEPVSGRDTYVPVRFAWPADYKTEGLDMSFSPERMASKLASQRTRMPVASGVFPFMKSGMVDSGVKAVAISTTVFDTDNIARSYVAAIVDLPTLFERAAQVADSVQVDLLVYPGGANSAQPFYTRFGESSDLKQGQVDSGLATAGDPAATVTFGQQAWRVVLHPRPGFYAELPPAHSHLMYASGFGLTLLMLVMLALHLRTNMRLQERTGDLVRSHQSLNEAQRIAQAGNWELDLLTNKLVWSDEIFRIFEIDKMRFGATYENFRAAIHPEDLDAVNVAYRQSLENRQPYGMTYRIQMPDGRIKYVHEQGESFFDANGKPLRSVGTVQDITERKRAEMVLHQSQERWKFAIEGAGDGLWDWNIQTGVAFYSQRYKEMFGYVEADFGTTSDEWSKRIHPDDAPGVFAALRPYMDGKPGSAAVEFRMLCKDGGWKWTLGRGMVVSRDADGKPLRMIGTNADITERKQAEAALWETQAMLARTEEIGKLGGWEFDIDTQQQIWTKAVYAIHEVDFTGQPTVAQGIGFYTPESRPIIEQAVRRAIEHGESFDLELEIITAKGNLRAVHTIGRHDPACRKIVGFFQDITERKQVDYLLRESEKKYRSLLGNLSAGVVVHNPDTSVVLANPAATSLLGLSEEQILGKTAIDPYWCFLHENGAPMPLQDFPVNQAIASRTEVNNWVLGVQRPDRAEPVWLICNASQIRDEMDNLVQVVVTFIDITERKQAEARNRESEKLRRSEQAAALEVQRQADIAALSLMEDTVAACKQAEAMSKALAEQLDELRRWQQVTLGREGRVLAMKKEVNSLLAERGQPPRYASAADAETET